MADSVPPLLRGQVVVPVIKSDALPPLLPDATGRLRTILIYRIWCFLFVLLYLSFSVYEVQVARGKVEPLLGLIETMVSHDNPSVREEIIAEKRRSAWELAVFAGLIALLYGLAAAIPRKPWAWTFGLVIICTTIFPYVITAAGAVPLLLAWTKPAMKLQFGCRR